MSAEMSTIREAFEGKIKSLKRERTLAELEIIGRDLREQRRVQYETAISHIRHDVDLRLRELHSAHEDISKLMTFRQKALEDNPYGETDNFFFRNEDVEDNHMLVQQFEFMMLMFNEVRDELGKVWTPRILIKRTLRSLDLKNEQLLSDAETHVHYINEHLEIDIPLLALDLIGMTRQFIYRHFSFIKGVDGEELAL